MAGQKTAAGMSIGAVARVARTPASAIRFYESIGLLPPAVRVNGRRVYGADTVQRLAVIRRGREAGFTLGEIRALFFAFASGTPPEERWRALAARKLEELDAQMARIEEMRGLLREGLGCGCLTIEQCTVWLSGRPA